MEKILTLFKYAFSKLGEGMVLSTRAVVSAVGNVAAAAAKKFYELTGKKLLIKLRPFMAVLMAVSGVVAVLSAVLFALGSKE